MMYRTDQKKIESLLRVAQQQELAEGRGVLLVIHTDSKQPYEIRAAESQPIENPWEKELERLTTPKGEGSRKRLLIFDLREARGEKIGKEHQQQKASEALNKIFSAFNSRIANLAKSMGDKNSRVAE